MINKIKYYISEVTDPYINLATEKYLFDNLEENCSILYLWQNDNTVVIGKNQNPWAECRCSLLNSEGGRLARRNSGGGAVYHDLGNLNFTFISCTNDFSITRNNKIIMSACHKAGINCEASGRNDILAEGRKFSGNAFFNSKGKSYHHGTLLVSSDTEKLQRYLTPSASKLEAKGVKSVKSRIVNLSTLSKGLTTELMKKYMLRAFEEYYNITAEQINNISPDSIMPEAEKYGTWDYIYGKTIPFSISLEKRLSCGCTQLLLAVDKGIISAVQVFTDSLDTEIPQKITDTLSGCRLDKTEIANAFQKSDLPSDIFDLFEDM